MGSLRSRVPFLVEAFSSFMLVPYYVFGVAIITYHNGPGAALGNLYYFTWLSFLLSFMLAAHCIEERYKSKGSIESTSISMNQGTGTESTGHEIS